MSDAPASLNDLFVEEMKDLWSANDQMTKVVKKMADKASDTGLQALLTKSIAGIGAHTDVLKDLIEAAGEKVKKEHCKGMEGLVAEATKHTLDSDAPAGGPVLDAQIIAQYQRMTHYGIAGFGTATAYAKALGEDTAAAKLSKATKEIYGGDEFATKLAETAVNARAE